MDNPYLDKEKELAKVEKSIAKKKWQCMCPRCQEEAINSHLLQRHGILDNVAEDGHLCELRMEDFFKWHKKDPIQIKTIGLNQAISYPLFCPKHDTELFNLIEGETINFDEYRSQLLFSYRGVCSEIRKKEFVTMRYGAWNEGELKEEHAKGTDKGIKDLLYYKYLFEDELLNMKSKFAFFHLTYPFISVYASGAISYEPVDYERERSIIEATNKKVWDAIFINIIPQKNSLEIIIGYNNNHSNRELRQYVESWKGLSLEQLQIKLTDLFTARLEMWGASPSFFENLKEEKKLWLLETIKRVHLDYYYNICKELDYNIFD